MAQPPFNDLHPPHRMASDPLFRLMTARMQELLCIYGPDGHYLYVSASCRALLGYAPEEMVGKHFTAFVHSDDQEAVYAILNTLQRDQQDVPRATLRICSKLHETCWMDAHFAAQANTANSALQIYSIARDITDQQQEEVSVVDTEARWKHFVEQHPEPIVISSRGIIRYINRAGTLSLDLDDPHDLIGRSLFEFILPRQHEMLHERITRVERGEKLRSEEYLLKGLTGELHRIQAFSVPIIYEGKQATQTVWHDITEQREAEESLRRSQRMLSSIHHNISEGIYRTSVDGTLIYGNQALAHIFGYESIEDLRKVPIEKLYVRPEQRGNLKTDLRGNARNAEVEFYRRDGSRFWGLVNSHSTFDAEGNLVYYDGAIADITERKKAEQTLREAKERAEEMTRLKSAFLANMSHEIRTPLTSILGFAEIMAEEAPAEIREFATLIQTGGQRLMETLNSVLDLAQLEGGSMMLHPTLSDAAELARRVLNMFKLQAQQRGITLRTHVPAKRPTLIWIDQGAFSRVLTNLVSNAVKFTPQGSVTIVIDRQKEGMEIRVEDTGIGIAADQLAHVFDEFYQASSGLTRDYEGSGLGLNITQRLVELMGGTIRAESELGTGSSFIIYFPNKAIGNKTDVFQPAHPS